MSAELGIVVALCFVSAMMMLVSFRYNESEEWSLGVLSQLFHGFSIVLWLPIMFVGYEFSLHLTGSAALEPVLGPVLAILGLLLFVYAMFMILRVVFGLINAGIKSAKRLAGFNREDDFDQPRTRGGLGR